MNQAMPISSEERRLFFGFLINSSDFVWLTHFYITTFSFYKPFHQNNLFILLKAEAIISRLFKWLCFIFTILTAALKPAFRATPWLPTPSGRRAINGRNGRRLLAVVVERQGRAGSSRSPWRCAGSAPGTS